MHTMQKITNQAGLYSVLCIQSLGMQCTMHTMQMITNQFGVYSVLCVQSGYALYYAVYYAYHAADYQVVRPPPPACSHLVPPHKRPLHHFQFIMSKILSCDCPVPKIKPLSLHRLMFCSLLQPIT